VKVLWWVIYWLIAVSAFAQSTPKAPARPNNPPRFEDYPVTEIWNQPPAALKLQTPSERMFETRLKDAAKEPPNFSGHYRVVFWGCGSNCSAGALVDLQAGTVFPLPLAKPNMAGWDRWIFCPALFEGANDEFHINSRLMVMRCGLNFSERLRKNLPDTYYFLWEQDHFRQLLHVSEKP
jgi:hypothetical protein